MSSGTLAADCSTTSGSSWAMLRPNSCDFCSLSCAAFASFSCGTPQPPRIGMARARASAVRKGGSRRRGLVGVPELWRSPLPRRPAFTSPGIRQSQAQGCHTHAGFHGSRKTPMGRTTHVSRLSDGCAASQQHQLVRVADNIDARDLSAVGFHHGGQIQPGPVGGTRCSEVGRAGARLATGPSTNVQHGGEGLIRPRRRDIAVLGLTAFLTF